SLTPAGILMGMISSLTTNPLASASAGFLSTIWPLPPQVGQVLADTIWPNMVLTTFFICPDPLQEEQDLKVTPLATKCLFTLIFFSTPLAISARLSLIF